MSPSLPVRQTIEELGTTAIARAMGIAISTVHDWKQADAIPGAGRTSGRGLHELRLRAFEKAVRDLRRSAGRRQNGRHRPAA